MSSANGKVKTSGAVQASAKGGMSKREIEILDAQLAAVRAGVIRLSGGDSYGAFRSAQELLETLYKRIGNTETFGSATVPLQMPCSGNLLVFTMAQGSDDSLSGIADGNGNSYTQLSGSPLANGPGGTVRLYYVANATTSSTMSMTLTFASAPPFGSDFVVYDVTGAAASPLDTSNTALGIQTSAGDLATVSITPAGSGELVIAHGDQNDGTITGLVGSGYLFDHPTWVGQDEGGAGGAGTEFTLDAQAGHYYTADGTPLTFVWTETRTVLEWQTIVAAFKGAVR